MGGKEQKKNSGKHCPLHGKDGRFALKVEEKNLYFMGNFYTLKCLACMLMGCNNEPVLYEVSANILALATVRE